MKYIYKTLDIAFGLAFGVIMLSALMYVAGFLSFFLSFGLWTGGIGWLYPPANFMFSTSFFFALGLGLIGVITGYLK
ncbi:hypothetical protein [Roseovarius sp. S4756]|uniref:hypothetical protein n=1 Tax=Roseovarius maritimus TaxID=3342637 RepID=UPI003726BDE2